MSGCDRERLGRLVGFVFLWVVGCLTGCGGGPEPRAEARPHLSLPTRVAILTVQPPDVIFQQDALLEQAYDRLEAKSWQLLTERADGQVFERRDLRILRSEQQAQHVYGVDEPSMVRLGKLAGVPAVLVYRIWLPSWRDRFFAKDQSLSLTIAGKLLDVESGAVLWAHTVTVSSSDCREEDCWFGGKPQGMLWPLLARGVDQLVAEFAQVVPCQRPC